MKQTQGEGWLISRNSGFVFVFINIMIRGQNGGQLLAGSGPTPNALHLGKALSLSPVVHAHVNIVTINFIIYKHIHLLFKIHASISWAWKVCITIITAKYCRQSGTKVVVVKQLCPWSVPLCQIPISQPIL